MKRLKIMHCGDIHFDTPFYNLPLKDSEKRREDLRETFGEIIELAKTEKIDILLIAGDLFDNKNTNEITLNYIKKKLSEIPNVKVFISPGNHDPYNYKSYYNILEWPKNLHIFKGVIEKVEIPELKTCVYGAGFIDNYQYESLLKGFCIENLEMINLMVIHGEITSYRNSNEYNPLYIEDIEKSQLDYLALGHRHEFSGIKKSGGTYWAYSGSPEGRGFDELEDKGILVGEISKNNVNLQFKPISKRKYYKEFIDISGALTYEDIVLKIKEEIKDEKPSMNLYKVFLEGNINKNLKIEPHIIEDKVIDDFFYIKIVDNTKVKLDLGNIKEDFSLKGMFVKKLLDKIECAENNEEKLKLENALKLGLKALDNEDVSIR